MTAETLWKIHEELDEIEAEKETAHAQIMMLIDTPIIDKDELIRRYKTD